MRAINMFRAAAWLGVVVVFWSLNVRWGSEAGLPGGPPTPLWERYVVGAGILAMVAALALSVSGRKDIPPSWWARGIAAVSALAVLAIGLYLRSQARGVLEDAIAGRGWLWLLSGAGLVMGAAIGSLGLRAPVKRPPKRRKRRK